MACLGAPVLPMRTQQTFRRCDRESGDARCPGFELDAGTAWG